MRDNTHNGGCNSVNPQFFDKFFGPTGLPPATAPIDSQGFTRTMTAQSVVTPGETYHIKLVVGDRGDSMLNSAVFLEGNSFNIGTDLGEDVTGADALCDNETYTLSVTDNGNTPDNYEWFLVNDNGSETLLTSGSTEDEYEVTSAGTYKVVLTFGANCTAEDTIVVEYVEFDSLFDRTIYECDTDNDGLSIFNLNAASQDITANNQAFTVTNYFLTDAIECI